MYLNGQKEKIMKIILASGSPRRKELLDLIKVKYEVIPSNADETLTKGLSLEEQSKVLAYKKAKSIFDKTQGDRIVIGADTLVVKNGKTYGKPKDLNEAKQMLLELNNDVHQVITSLAILVEKEKKQEENVLVDITNVYLSNLSEQEIEEYIHTEEVLDKAGSYAIQSSFGKYVEKIEGNYTTVLGLPIHKLYEILKKYNLKKE